MDNRGVVRLGMPYNQRPKPEDLHKFLTAYCQHWRGIGLKLGLNNPVLNEIASAHPMENRECFRVTLEKWSDLNVEVTWGNLELAITNANRESLNIEPLTTMLTSEPEIETPQIDNQSTQPQECDSSQEKDVIDYTQLSIFAAFERLNGLFCKEYKERNDTADVSKLLKNYCKKYFKSNVDFSHTSMSEILDKMFDLPFHNFLNVDLLMFVASFHNYTHLIESIKMYENTYFSMKLNDLFKGNRRYIKDIKIKERGKIISQSARTKLLSHCTIYEFKNFVVKFSNNILYVDVGLALPEILEGGCVCVEWLIPSQLADYMYHSACINTGLFHKLHLSYLEIGRAYRIEPVKASDGCLYKNPIQIFCEHYQLLVENMKPESLLERDDIQQVLLLSDGELDHIQTAPIDFMKNLYIVEKVRHMETAQLFVFLDVLQDVFHQPSNSILNALKLAGFTRLEDSSTMYSNNEVTIVNKTSECSFDYDEKELQSSLEKFTSKRKRLLSPNSNNNTNYFSPSSILLEYLDLCDSLAQLLQSLQPGQLINAISCFVAIDTHDNCVKQFSAEYVGQLKDCSNSVEVLTKLFPYSNWYDHSIIRELLEACECSEGIHLLDEFDSRIDLIQSITEFPMFVPSPLIIPSDSSYHTVMATCMCHKLKLSSLKLCHIGEIKSEMLQMCNLTKYSCLFLAITKSTPAIIYWLIPRNLFSSISNSVWNFKDSFYKSGIIEIAIYPCFVFSTHNTSNVLSLDYFSFISDNWIQQSYQLEPDTLGEENVLQDDITKDVLIKELRKAEVDINTYREEISDKNSQIEMLRGLEKVNKQLVTKISELKVSKKGKSVALQTDVAVVSFAADTSHVSEKVTSNLSLNKIMNVVCYMQEKWYMVGMRLKIPPSILDDICKECDDNRIPADSADTFCSIKMFNFWLSSGENISVDTLLNVLGTVNLKYKISSIKTALESHLVIGNHSNPPEKQQQSYLTMLTKVSIELNKSEVDINDVLIYLKLSNIDLNVLENVAKFSDLLHSLEKYNYLTKTDLSWLKYVVDYVRNMAAQKIINDYETSLLADKIYWSGSHPSGTFLVGRISNKPETVTIKNNSLAKSAASDVVGIRNTDSILDSSEVGSVIFYWKITNGAEFEIPNSISNSVKTKCKDAGVTHIGKMVDGNAEFMSINELECPEVAVENFSEDLHYVYKDRRNILQSEQWPLYQPTSMGNVTCIHYKNKQERQELIKMCNRFKTGTYGIGGLVSSLPSHSKVTMNISEIFEIDPADQTEGSTEIKPPKLILIEGAPGIGKTILAREIAYLWANQKLLKDYKLVILVYLRDPRVHTMKTVKELFQLYTNEKVAGEVSNYLEKINGQNVVFIFDGFDEFPISQEKSIVTDIIGTSSDNVRKFCKSTVVVTSRLSTTLILHKIVDSRIEILGFAPKEFGELASQSVLQFPSQREESEKFFKKHPIIIGLCYSPLNLSIILYLFHQGNLPKTLTEVNESIIVHMVYRHIMKTESPFSLAWRTDCLKDMPKNIYQVLHKLSKLAFDGLCNDQFVFTHDKLKDVCPEIFDLPEAANGFSLLQAVQLYSQKGATTMKFNFLNLTMQEYLAAHYVSTLPEEQQLELLQNTFWDDRFNFMWKMYVGNVGVESVSFASFLRMKDTHTITVKSEPRSRHHIDIFEQIKNLRYLHLFLCYMEAKANARIPQKISTIFSGGTVDFMDITLHSHHIISLLVFMFIYSTQQWKSFTLNKCNLQRSEINILMYNINNNKERMSTLKYVDLNENGSSPWGIYSVIIRHSNVNSLELCGDEGMNEYINEVTDSLQANATIQSLSLFSIGKVGVESIKMVLMNKLSLKRLTLSWQTKPSKYRPKFKEVQIHTIFPPNTNDAMHIKTKLNESDYNKVDPSYDVYVCYRFQFVRLFLPWDQDDQLEPIYLEFSNRMSFVDDERINDDAVHVLLFGLRNNKKVKQLNLSNNSITDDGAVAIIECLKHNNTIKKLDLSHNRITFNGMNKMLESITKQETTLSLEYIDLSRNGMSSSGFSERHHLSSPCPWGVYCAIIRHCCSDSLTLCGDKGMKEYIKEITDSLQANTTLQSLMLFDIKTVGVQSVKAVLMNKSQFTLKALNLSLYKISSKTLQDYVPLNKLSHNTDVAIQNTKEHPTHRGIRNVTLKYNIKVNQKSLFLSFAGDVNNETFFGPKSIDLSNRQIFDDALSLLAFGLCDNTLALEEVNISDNYIKDEGAMAIFDLLKNIKSLKKLDLSENMIEVNGMNEILRYIENQGTSSLEYVDLSKNMESPWGVYCAIIRHCRVSRLTLCGDDDMDRYLFREEIIKSMDVNTRLHSLTIRDVDEKIYETFKYHCSERFNERLLQSQMWRDIEFAKPYKKLRCYSLSSSDVINGKITLVVSISERNDGDHLPNTHDQR